MINIASYFHKVCYINLEEDVQKKKYFEKEIQKSDFLASHCRRYDAVIGKYIDIRLIPDSIITTKAKNDIIEKKQRTYGISLTYGSLACALSHHLIYQECKSQHKPFCIFEDDIIIDNNFDKNLNALLEDVSKRTYDIIYLGYNEIPGFQKKVINNIVSEPRGLITGLYGYIVSNRGAQKLLDNIFPLYKQIDSCISDHRDKFELLCATHKFVNVRTDFGSKTQLDSSCKNIHTEIGPYSDWHKLFQ